MTLDQNAVIRARCAAQAISVLKAFDRDPQQYTDEVAKLAIAILCVLLNIRGGDLTDALGKQIEDACAYALAADAITRSSLDGGPVGALIR